MSTIIPKERLSAWQRWEMASFDPPPPPPPPQPLPPNPLDDPALAQQIAAWREEARAEGHAQGYATGHAEGYAAGQAAGQRDVDTRAAQLADIAHGFGNAVNAIDREVAEPLLGLALDIARQALRQTLTMHPETLLPIVRDLLSNDPVTGSPRLLLHPEDVALVEAHVGAELRAAGWAVRADPAIERGGCKAEAASGEVDATVATRWQRVMAALGKDLPW
ncbi:flagellar assembly protein FliH [Pandoraea terrigena]|uniref:Flagellar assembly protein FliH n=1 Tax=Pandoraea terrigena TaxID=2508292 RepID=A0A5E4VXB3_9BURK|nr:flagellar assembly protein FliH [Pandoraea terrigena]VVE16483.1 flagellar assembly protein FliH [Pandoraea terrigena]